MGLRLFGQHKIQPLLMKLAGKERFRRISEKMLPLVTVEDCMACPLLQHCANACIGFKNLVEKMKEGEGKNAVN
ncbi:MAG: hypothetical protein QW175_05880 [Candidatus Bathyarchaeia archaeon]